MRTGRTTGLHLADSELEALCLLTCPHCSAAAPISRNPASGEFTHVANVSTYRGGVEIAKTISNTICWANGLRREFENG